MCREDYYYYEQITASALVYEMIGYTKAVARTRQDIALCCYPLIRFGKTEHRFGMDRTRSSNLDLVHKV